MKHGAWQPVLTCGCGPSGRAAARALIDWAPWEPVTDLVPRHALYCPFGMPDLIRFACLAAPVTQRWLKRPVGYVSRVCQYCSTFAGETSPASPPGEYSAPSTAADPPAPCWEPASRRATVAAAPVTSTTASSRVRRPKVRW